ncbi:intermembrane phospholipid transport protein YdbH family protein [Rhodovibrionaceae bacterium A322]
MTDKGPKRRRTLQLAIGALLLLVLLPVLAYGLRVPLANWAISLLLAEREIEGHLRVERLDIDGLEVSTIALPGLEVDSLSAQWLVTPWPPAFQLLAVEVQKPKVTLTLDKAPLWPLQAYLPASSPAQDPSPSLWDQLPLLPPLTISSGEVLLISSDEQATVTLETAITGAASSPRQVTAEADLKGFGLNGQGKLSLDLQNNQPTKATFWLEAQHAPRSPLPASDLRLKSELDVKPQSLKITGSGKGQLDSRGLGTLAQKVPQLAGLLMHILPETAQGALTLSLDGSGTWALEENLKLADPQPEALDLSIDVSSQALTWPGFVTGADASWAGQLTKTAEVDGYLWRPSKDLTFSAQETEGRLFPEEIRTRLPQGFFVRQGVTLALSQLLLDKAAKRARFDNLNLLASDGAGDRLALSGSASLDLSQDLWADADLKGQVHLPAPWPGLTDLSLDLAGQFHHDQHGSLLELRQLDHLTVTSDPAHWPEQLAQLNQVLDQFSLGDQPFPLSLTASSPSGSEPLLKLFLEPDSFSFSSQANVLLSSPLWQNLDLSFQANGDKTADGDLLLDFPALQVHSTALQSPYGSADVSVTGSASYLSDFFTGDLKAELTSDQLTLPQGTARSVKLDLPVSASGSLQEVFWHTGQATLALKDLKAANQVRISPVLLTLQEGSGRIAGMSLTSDLQVALAPSTIRHPSQTLELGAGQAKFHLASQEEGEARVSFSQAQATEAQIQITSPSFTLSRNDSGALVMNLTEAQLQDLSSPSRFPKLHLSGKTELTGDTLFLSLDGRLPQADDTPFNLLADYQLDRKKGTTSFDLQNLIFDPGLQPGDLHPLLASLSEVEGSLSLAGTAEISPDGLGDSQAEITLQLDEATTPYGQISDLSVPLVLTSLWPLESAPDQAITLDRFGQELALEDLFLRYHLTRQPSGESPLPVLSVAEARMRLLGGQLNLGPGDFNPLDENQSLLLTAEDLDLVTVLSLISKEGLTGTGDLEGRIPLELRNGDIVIDGAHLRAERPGRLAFSSPPTDQALSTGGDHVQLLLSALENFHYTDLLLELDKAPDGQSRVLLKMEGSNPDLYDGYPFSLNLNLETAAAPLLSALATGSSLYDEMIKRAVQNR